MRVRARRLGDTNYYGESEYIARIYCIAQGISPIFYNNFKLTIIYKIIELLWYIPETNMVS